MRTIWTILAGMVISGCSPPPADKPSSTESPSVQVDTTPRVTGIGGIFFTSEDPQGTKEWYAQHLGLATDDYGSPFEFRNALDPSQINYLRWSLYPEDTDQFAPSDKPFMINYRVHNLAALVSNLREAGVTILDTITEYPYGKFVHIMDPDGNKIELWEPVDSVLTAMGGTTTK
ncbi:MAG: VOC family protein [Saprospiraceae bacterium]|nr:VOC family protein [Saprospiraceae bacterium]